MRTLDYRPEIDGLRALAVSFVVIYHAFPSLLPGGFIGVDVFFVISGFLITRIIFSEISQGDFSLWSFYDRRIRRILPALFVMMMTTIPFAWLLLPNSELISYFYSLAGAAAFSSNVVFLLQADYFGTAASNMPLLHTWSLAIEEQFYIVLPVFLIFMHRWRPQLVMNVTLFFVAASLALCLFFTPRMPESSFFLIHTRFWELGAGALLALWWPEVKNSVASSVATVGALLIVVGLVYIDERSEFPGAAAVLPVLGTSLMIIGARHDNYVGRFLSVSPMQIVGRMSYSIYLWHWPILVLGDRIFIKGANWHERSVLVMLCLLVAWASWRFIERPVRHLRINRIRAFVIITASILAAVSISAYWAGISGIGRDRVTVSGITTAQMDSDRRPNLGLGRCDAFTQEARTQCTTSSDPSTILWGDSYAMHLAQAMQVGTKPFSFEQITKSACGPFVGYAWLGGRYGAAWGAECIEFNDRALDIILASSAKNVVISSTFALLDADVNVTVRGGEAALSADGAKSVLVKTIQELKNAGKKVVLVSPMPSANFDISECLTRSVFLNVSSEPCNFPEKLNSQSDRYGKIGLVADQASVPVLFLSDLSCKGAVCLTSLGGVPLYRDNMHMSPNGSRRLGEIKDLSGQIDSLLNGNLYP